jgi:hypothetical protein
LTRFETELLATDENLAALAWLSGSWVDKLHDCRPPKITILNMNSSVSPTYGDQEGSACNGHSADGWRDVLEPVVERYRERDLRR